MLTRSVRSKLRSGSLRICRWGPLRRGLTGIGLVTASVFFGVLLGDGIVRCLLAHPRIARHLPGRAFENLYALYFNRVRNIIQFDARMGRYDPELFYTLKPGEFDFSNPEYDVHFSVNTLGVRDREDARVDPDVVVIGDSFAMGWGVPQQKSFPKLLEQRTGHKVLNLGVASYGTVRERMMLDRAGVKPRVLLIQYCDNDLNENAWFYLNHGYHPRSEEDYRRLVALNRSNTRYFPGKYWDGLLGADWFGSLWGIRPVVHDWELPLERSVPLNDAELFLHALVHAGKMDLRGVRIVLFELKAMRVPNDSRFLRRVSQASQSPVYPDWVRSIILAEIAHGLHEDSFFTIDDHLNERGHQRLAELLAPALATEMHFGSQN